MPGTSEIASWPQGLAARLHELASHGELLRAGLDVRQPHEGDLWLCFASLLGPPDPSLGLLPRRFAKPPQWIGPRRVRVVDPPQRPHSSNLQRQPLRPVAMPARWRAAWRVKKRLYVSPTHATHLAERRQRGRQRVTRAPPSIRSRCPRVLPQAPCEARDRLGKPSAHFPRLNAAAARAACPRRSGDRRKLRDGAAHREREMARGRPCWRCPRKLSAVTGATTILLWCTGARQHMNANRMQLICLSSTGLAPKLPSLGDFGETIRQCVRLSSPLTLAHTEAPDFAPGASFRSGCGSFSVAASQARLGGATAGGAGRLGGGAFRVLPMASQAEELAHQLGASDVPAKQRLRSLRAVRNQVCAARQAMPAQRHHR